MNKARMTFRFDKPEEQRNEAVPLNNIQSVPEYTEEPERAVQEKNPGSVPLVMDPLESWGEPFLTHSHSGARVIPEMKEMDTHLLEDSAPHDDVYYISPKKPSKWKLAGSISAALVTGTLFGFVLLSLFNKDISFPIPGISSLRPDSTVSSPSVSVLGPTDEPNTPNGDIPMVKAVLPDQAYYFLQYGVFSTSQGVKQAQEELQQSGVAAARDTLDHTRVYAGVSPEREQAKLLSSQLKSSGVNLIVHEIRYPAEAQLKYGGDIGVLDQYLEESADLIKLLSVTSASLLETKEVQKQSQAEVANLKEKHRQWTENASAVKGGLPSDVKPTADTMEKAMNTAVEALSRYNSNGSKTHLWEVQTAMMEYILLQKELLGIKQQ
ncbi:SPOR domain-containing protein [Paenibacillus sp. YPG26]|uniref:SPOR domain-containing protein n=1 Tax=Paenibacillus sp. YPG26 TaxID=2878915 RepID=UPI002040DBEE|nr:SPOR domain-containing protein [Paenibacillus sp. YPG26]USB34249.1 SPOR domain-containing protein [Paenibacillus sp. YPG26]